MSVVPTHSRTVKVVTEAEVLDIGDIIGSLTYETTEYCIHLNASKDSVKGIYSVQSKPEDEPFVRITGIEEIAAGVPKRVIRDPQLDVANILDVLCWLKKKGIGSQGPEARVFISRHDHITFAFVTRPLILPEIQVIDVVPPSPSKLEVAFKTLRYSGLIPQDYPVAFHLTNEASLVERIKESDVLIPCSYTEVMDRVPQRVYSVDRDLYDVENQSIHVVGCQRTREAAEACGAVVKDFDDICPAQNLPTEGVFFAKCCLLRNHIRQQQNENATGVVVPWGFNYAHIFQAAVTLQEIIVKSVVSSDT